MKNQQSPAIAKQALEWLKIVRWVALADLILLAVLLPASFADHETLVRYFGLTHGLVFLALLAIVGMGSLKKLWGWWFLLAIIITTGPPGAFVGEIVIARRAKATLAAWDGGDLD